MARPFKKDKTVNYGKYAHAIAPINGHQRKYRYYVQVNCAHCGKSMAKFYRRVDAMIDKHGIDDAPNHFYCDKSCLSTHRHEMGVSNLDPVKGTDKQRDMLLKKGKHRFHDHFRRIRKSAANKDYVFDLTIDDLDDIWEEQEGRCALSGVPLYMRFNTVKSVFGDPDPKGKWNGLLTASIDRIDSRKGYIKGNVQWVALCMNLAKKNTPDEDFIEVLKIIAEYLPEHLDEFDT